MKRSIFILALAQTGCMAPSAYTQSITGVIRSAESAVVGVPVRFILSPSGEPQSCSPAGAEAITDSNGNFSLVAKYEPKQTERFAVLVQRHLLCAQLNGQWVPIWELKTGPALPTISVKCMKYENTKVVCEG